MIFWLSLIKSSRKQICKNFCSFLFMLNFGNQYPFRILFHILSVIVVNCNLIISVMAAWPIKFTAGSKSGKRHPLPIDLSTENKFGIKIEHQTLYVSNFRNMGAPFIWILKKKYDCRWKKYALEKPDRATKTSLFDRNWAISLKPRRRGRPLRLDWWVLAISFPSRYHDTGAHFL